MKLTTIERVQSTRVSLYDIESSVRFRSLSKKRLLPYHSHPDFETPKLLSLSFVD